MSGNRETRNFGLIKAIHVGVNPPLNIKMLWYDDNSGQKIHKYYEVSLSQWIPLGGNGTVTVNGTFAYMAYATDCSGENFSLTLGENSTHWALVVSATEIAVGDLVPELFENKWTAFCGESSGTGNFTYVRYADDCEGDNFGETPSYEVACEECSWLESSEFSQIKIKGNWQLISTPGGILVKFQDVTIGNFIQLGLLKDGSVIPNNSSQYILVEQNDSWTAVDNPNQSLEFNTDINSVDNYLYTNSPNQSTGFVKIFNGSQITISVPSTNDDRVSGEFVLKIGNTECENEPEYCLACRKYMGIIISDTEIENVTAELFSEVWVPIGSCGCGCSGGSSAANSSIENLAVRIDNLSKSVSQGDQANKLLIDNLNSDYNNYKISQNSINDDLQEQITNNKNSVDNRLDTLTSNFDDQAQSLNDIDSRVSSIESTLDEAGIIAIIGSAINQKIADFDTNVVQPAIADLSSRISDNDGELANHETRINNLETI